MIVIEMNTIEWQNKLIQISQNLYTWNRKKGLWMNENETFYFSDKGNICLKTKVSNLGIDPK